MTKTTNSLKPWINSATHQTDTKLYQTICQKFKLKSHLFAIK